MSDTEAIEPTKAEAATPQSSDSEPSTSTSSNQIPFTGHTLAGKTLIQLGGVIWILGISSIFNGLAGIAVGILVGVTMRISHPVITVGVAHAGLLVLYPELTTVQTAVEIALFECGLLAILLGERYEERDTALLTIILSVVFGMTFVALNVWKDTLIAATGLVFITLLLAYGIHRYERVSLGLVTTDTDIASNRMNDE